MLLLTFDLVSNFERNFRFIPVLLLCYIEYCILWCIGREINQWIFEGKEIFILNLKFLFLKTLFEWVILFYYLNFLSNGVFRLIVLVSLILLLPFLSLVSFCFLNLCILPVYAFPNLINYNYLLKKKLLLVYS